MNRAEFFLRHWWWKLRHAATTKRASNSPFAIKGNVQVVLRRSELYPNPKTRGLVSRFLDLGSMPIDSERVLNLGSNLFVEQGRTMAAGLLVGTTGVGAGVGSAETTGFVIRGMALGSDGTAESDTDTGLLSPWVNSALTPAHYYHEIDTAQITDTKAIFTHTFTASEPQSATLSIREYGLYTASPGGGAPQPAVTTPAGPSGGYQMVARKTHGLITKSTDFTMAVRWTIEY